MNTPAPYHPPVPESTVARHVALRACAEAEQKQQAQGASVVSRLRGGAAANTPIVRRPSSSDRYGGDMLLANPHYTGPGAMHPEPAHVPITPGLAVEDRQISSVGAAVAVEKSGGQHVVVLEDRHGVCRGFALGPGFWIEGRPVILNLPVARKCKPIGVMSAAGGRLTASGPYAVEGGRAKVTHASRTWVEDKHDAELVEKVWGDDPRREGVAVFMLDGVDSLEEVMADFGPAPEWQAGVLADHLVVDSKESWIAQRMSEMSGGKNVLVLGHSYVDVWQAVKPARIGLKRWPDIPWGTDIKHGTLKTPGWSYATQADTARGWQRILATVRSYKDPEPSLLGRMEELIDFVAAPGTH